LPIELAEAGATDEALSVSTINIGAGGVYLEIPRFIAPLTKLQLAMHIPGPTPEEEPVFLETEAIVVRTLPEQEEEGRDRYEVACAFLSLPDEHRDAINRYVLTHRATPA
jgi:hypothetical protein